MDISADACVQLKGSTHDLWPARKAGWKGRCVVQDHHDPVLGSQSEIRQGTMEVPRQTWTVVQPAWSGTSSRSLSVHRRWPPHGILTRWPQRGNRRSGGDCNDWLTSQSTRRNPPLADLASANRGGTLGASWLDEIRAHRLPKRSTAHMWPAVRAASRTRSRLASGQYSWLAGRSMGRTHPARTGAA